MGWRVVTEAVPDRLGCDRHGDTHLGAPTMRNLGRFTRIEMYVHQQGRTNLGDPIVDSNQTGRAAAGDEMATLFGVLCFATLGLMTLTERFGICPAP